MYYSEWVYESEPGSALDGPDWFLIGLALLLVYNVVKALIGKR